MVDTDPEEVLSVDGAADEEDIDNLRKLCQASPEPTMRVQAANVLGEIGDSVGESRRQEIVDDLITVVLRDDSDEVRATAIDALDLLDGDNIDKLVSVVSEQVKYSQTETDVASFFASWLDSSASEFRLVGAAAMEQFGGQSAVDELEAAFDDSDPRVRARAVQAYGTLDEEIRAGALEPLLEDDREIVRRAAARTLGRLDSEAAFDVLVAASRAADETLREAAVEQLVQFDRADAVVALIRALLDSSQRVRYRTAHSLLDMLSASDRITAGSVPEQISTEVDAAELTTLAETLFEIATDPDDDGTTRRIRVHAVWLLGELLRSRSDHEMSRLLVMLLQSDMAAVTDLAAAYLKLLEGEGIERELQTLISDSTATPAGRSRAKTILKRVKRNAASAIVEQSIEYTYVQEPSDYTIKHGE
jgi:HEAT repeat protein